MQVTETLNEGLKRGYHFVVPATFLNEKVEEKLAAEQPNIQLNGFRKGKVPISLIRRLFAKGVKDEIRESTLKEKVDTHFSDSDERPATRPSIDIKSSGETDGEDLSFSLAYEVFPDIPEIDFKTIELEKLVVAADDAMIQARLESLAERFGSFEDAEAGAKAELGHMVVLDFKGLIDGEEFDEGTGEGFPVVLGDDLIAPGFDEQLIGAGVGSNVEVKATYPDEHRNEALRGKDAVFSCTVKQLKTLVPREIDDDLAKKVDVNSLEELKDGIRNGLESDLNNDSRFLMRYRLFDRLEEMLEFELPPSLLEAETGNVIRQLSMDEVGQGGDGSAEATDDTVDESAGDEGAADADSDDEGAVARPDQPEPTADHIRIAKRRLRLGLFFTEVGRSNDIEVTVKDLESAAARLEMQDRRATKIQYLEYISRDRGFRSAIEQGIIERKVVDFMLELVEVTDREASVGELREALAAIDG